MVLARGCGASLTIAGAIAGLSGVCGAQPDWRPIAIDNSAPVGGVQPLFDSLRGETVMAAGPNGTWAFDGAVWRQRSTTSPPASYAVAAYDSTRGRIVLTGLDLSMGVGATWEWDGALWTRLTPSTRPTGRFGHAMAYDPLRRRTVLFGGNADPGDYVSETWMWDGSVWTWLPGGTPSGRSGHAMVFDAASGRIVMFGGADASGRYLDETWEWDGQRWTQRHPSRRPSPRASVAFTWDPLRGRSILHGGSDGLTSAADHWEWDGNEWTRLGSSELGPRAGHWLVVDSARRRTLMYESSGVLWASDGSGWEQLSSGLVGARSGFASAVGGDGTRAFVFGGAYYYSQGVAYYPDFWRWDGRFWHEHRGASGPLARANSALAYDSGRDRLVLFGGYNRRSLDDTWEWDGRGFVARTPTMRPLPRFSHSMAYDARRGRTVLFGGALAAGNNTGDTWEWDGVDWQMRTSLWSPTPRYAAGLAYDARRGRCVLFGGSSNSTYSGETWEWDGNGWGQRFAPRSPSPRAAPAMAYDPVRERIVLYGGVPGALRDTWEWDGVTWTERATTLAPDTGQHRAMVFDAVGERCVLIGNAFGGRQIGLWGFASDRPARFTPFGSGCAGTAGTPLLRSEQRPWLGDGFTVSVTGLSATGAGAYLLLGLSRTAWGNLRLPLDLAAVGMPGCRLWVSLDEAAAGYGSGAASWTLSLPNDVSFASATFYLQALVIDPLANQLGVVGSDAAECVVGVR